MNDELERRRRLLKLQKMKQEKAKRDLANSKLKQQTITDERHAILSMLSDGCMAERLFPKLTYDRLRTLDSNLVHANRLVSENARKTSSEKKKFEKTLDAVRQAIKQGVAETESLEQTELIDSRTSKSGPVTVSGKIADID